MDCISSNHIKTLYIPSSITYFHDLALSPVGDLERIFMYHEHPEDIEIDIYYENDDEEVEEFDCILYVTIGTGYAYRHHPFFGKYFKNIIPIRMKPYDEEPD